MPRKIVRGGEEKYGERFTAPIPIIEVYNLSVAFFLTVLMNVVVLASLVGTRSVITKMAFSLALYWVVSFFTSSNNRVLLLKAVFDCKIAIEGARGKTGMKRKGRRGGEQIFTSR
jgi:hypothetical protein